MEVSASFITRYTWKLPEGVILKECDYTDKYFGANKKNVGKWQCTRGKLCYVDSSGKKQTIEHRGEGWINVPHNGTLILGSSPPSQPES
jgi:hypothetical protein